MYRCPVCAAPFASQRALIDHALPCKRQADAGYSGAEIRVVECPSYSAACDCGWVGLPYSTRQEAGVSGEHHRREQHAGPVKGESDG